MAVPVSELQKIAPSAVIELFELQLFTALHGTNDIYRFHNGTNALAANGNLVWAGNTYQAMPIEAEGFEYSGTGQLPRPKIRVSNIMGTITAIIVTLPNGLEGAQVTRIRTLARYLDAVNFPGGTNPYGTPDPTASFPSEIYTIDRKSSETRDVVEFELAAAFDLIGVRAPKRQCISNICQWVYRSAECSYAGTSYYDTNDNIVATSPLDVCSKRLSGCEARFKPFSLVGAVTTGSTSMTVSSTANIVVGNPVSGVGIASGTTVSTKVNSTTLTLSTAATGTTGSTKTGTPSATTSAMTVANSTGLLVGMTVIGTYIPAGTTVSTIAGTNLTLSARPYSFTRTGIYRSIYLSSFYISIDITGLSAGMRVWGSNGIDTTIATVASGGLAGTRITLSSYAGLIGKQPISINLYFMPASPGSATYSFGDTNNSYIFRNPTASLPFGSFPGVGSLY